MIPERVKRVSESLKEVLSEIIQYELKDPRIGFVTVTHVEMSADLRFARVWVSVLGSEEENHDLLKALDKAKGFIKGEISKRLRLRYMPELSFLIDSNVEAYMRIDEILQRLREEEKGNE